jgi:hypothetical protein
MQLEFSSIGAHQGSRILSLCEGVGDLQIQFKFLSIELKLLDENSDSGEPSPGFLWLSITSINIEKFTEE